MTLRRRTLLQAGAAASAAASIAGFAGHAFAQPRTKVRVGYLHTLAVDGQMWLADSMGLWKKEGLDMEFIKFQTGLELFQDMGGGSIDVLTLLVKCGLAASKGEARRLVQQGGVSVNDEKVAAIETTFDCEQFTGDGVVIKKGKKVFHKASK